MGQLFISRERLGCLLRRIEPRPTVTGLSEAPRLRETADLRQSDPGLPRAAVNLGLAFIVIRWPFQGFSSSWSGVTRH